MDDRDPPKPRPGPPRARRLQLWHWSAAVMAVAVLLGLVRGLGAGRGGFVARGFLIASIGLGTVFLLAAYFVFCVKLFDRVSRAVHGWGERRERPFAFLAFLVAVLAFLFISLVSITVVFLALGAWLALVYWITFH